MLLQDSLAKSRIGINASRNKVKFKSKHEELKVLKGSLWELLDSASPNPSINSLGSGDSKKSSPRFLSSQAKKVEVYSVELDDVKLLCADSLLYELTERQCRLLLAVPDCLERYEFVTQKEGKFASRCLIGVKARVMVNTRLHAGLAAVIRWIGRLPGKQGLWFGVEIQVIRCTDLSLRRCSPVPIGILIFSHSLNDAAVLGTRPPSGVRRVV